MRNGVWRLTFLATLFFLSAMTVKGLRGMPDPGLYWLVGIHLFWALFAGHVATKVNQELCAILLELDTETYAKTWRRATEAQPVDYYKADARGTFQPVRRPLLDAQMGLRERP